MVDCRPTGGRDAWPTQSEISQLRSGMAQGGKVFYEFGPFRVDPEKQILLRENQPVAITPKAFETLLVLVQHSREVVSKDELMKAVWPDAFVEEANLAQNIFMLRKVLGDTTEDRRYIVTLPGRGYRFAASVRAVAEDSGELLIASRSRSQIVVEETESAPPLILPSPPGRKFPWKHLLAFSGVLALLVAGSLLFLSRRPSLTLGEKDTVLIADFTNTTGDPVFDDTLRQGLTVQLAQSPFLSLISEDRIQQTLALMAQPPGTRLTPEFARQVCTRTGGAAVLEGSITTLGTQYVLGLRAQSCATGELLDQEQAQAARKEDVLNALSRIARRFRVRVGESLATVKQHDTPLPQATTPSLEALQAYSLGIKAIATEGDAGALPLFQRASALDPNFAMAYAWAGRVYGDLGEAALSAENTTQAYQLRRRVSDQEQFSITAAYYTQVTENLERAQQTCEVWAQTYPRDALPHAFLSGVIYPVFGNYEQQLEESGKVTALDPDFAIAYYAQAAAYQHLGRLEEAEKALARASQRKLQTPDLLLEQYDLAFLKGDEALMEGTLAQARHNALAQEWVTQHQSSVLAYSGRLRQADQTAERATALAQEAGHREAAALYRVAQALWEGFFDNALAARDGAAAALAISNDRGVEYGAGLAFALAGDSPRAEILANDLEKRFPEDTSVRVSYLPALRARLALNRGQTAKAIDLLNLAAPYELGMPRTAIHANFGALYPTYLRGLADLAAHRAPAAAKEFQKILDHLGIVGSDPIGALARLQLARALAASGNTAQARAAYQKFLALWKNADPGIPLLKQAKAENARLR